MRTYPSIPSNKYFLFASILFFGMFFLASHQTHAAAGTIIDGYQQSTFLDQDLNNDGFDDLINWKPDEGTAVTVSDTELAGDIWGESVGWIRLRCVSSCGPGEGDDWGVTNTTGGILAGYAWGQNTGWISFSCANPTSTCTVENGSWGVTIDTDTGEFEGHAWSQNYGWIKFDCSGSDTAADADDFIDTCVKTDWSPEEDETPPPPSPPPLIDVCPNLSGSQINIPFGYTYQNGMCVPVTPPTPAICADTIDNDNDGLTDYPADLGCSNASDQSEYNQPQPPDCIGDDCYPVATTCEQLGNCPQPDDSCTNGDCPPPPNEGSCVGGNCEGLPPPVNETFPPGNGGSGEPSSGIGFESVSRPVKEFFSIINDTFSLKGDSATKTVSLVGILAMAFALPFTFWPALLAVFGYRRRRAWGTVYDSVTKHPLDPARVILFDLSGNEIGTSLTDIDGRFSFNVSPGTYRVAAYKEGYTFPSQNLLGKISDEIYSNLYFGESFVINSSNENILQNIPMDAVNISGGEREKSLNSIHVSNHRVFSHIASAVFVIGFIFSLIALISSPTAFNIIVVSVYGLFIIFRQTIIYLAPAGGVIDRTTGQPIGGAIVHIIPAGHAGQGMRKVTNSHGVYHARVPNGQYTVSVDYKQNDGTYQKVQEEVLVTHGSLSKVFEI